VRGEGGWLVVVVVPEGVFDPPGADGAVPVPAAGSVEDAGAFARSAAPVVDPLSRSWSSPAVLLSSRRERGVESLGAGSPFPVVSPAAVPSAGWHPCGAPAEAAVQSPAAVSVW
jgi:hypothetical protein